MKWGPKSIERFRRLTLPVSLPLSFVWEGAARLCARKPPRAVSAPCPVISVGNVHSGGTGKTPVVVALARAFADLSPVVLSRGYGGEAAVAGAWVQGHEANGSRQYGDEPWMMWRMAGLAVYVSHDRGRALDVVRNRKPAPGLLILDDGFQHRRVRRNVDLVLLHGRFSPSDAFCLPLGDLREPLSALERAHAFLLTGPHGPWEDWLRRRFPDKPAFASPRRILGLYRGDKRMDTEGAVFGGFCGIGDPDGFLSDLKTLGTPVFFEAFADHHDYSDKELGRLAARLPSGRTALLVTTDKDWYKLPPVWASRTVSIRSEIQIPDEGLHFLREAMRRPL